MYCILYLPTGELVRHHTYNMILKLPTLQDARTWADNNRYYMKTDTVPNISERHLLEIVEVDYV